MASYEYKVIPAPTKGVKAPGLKTAEARFAGTVEATLNDQASGGWEYLRTDILPSDERQGLTGSQTVYRTLMVFRRPKSGDDNTAEDVIQTAQDVAEAVSTRAEAPGRREPTLTPVQPSRADPAPAPDTPSAPTPRPERPEGPERPQTPGPDREPPKKD